MNTVLDGIREDLRIKYLSLIIVSCFGIFGASALCNESLSPVSVVADQKETTLYIAETTAGKVDIVDISGGSIAGAIKLPQNPSGLALSSDDEKLYVTGDGPNGKLFTINLQTSEIVSSIPAGHTPMSPVVDTERKRVYVCNRFNNNIAIIDLEKGQVIKTIPVKRQPVACCLSSDGEFLFVANHLPAGAANGLSISAEIDVIDTTAGKVVQSIPLPSGSTALRGLCLSPDGRYIYATHILARYTMPTTQLDRGWMNTNAMSIIDVSSQRRVTTLLLDDLTEGAANPWAVACSPDGKFLCVTHAGTQEVSIIDRAGLHQKLEQIADGTYEADPALTMDRIPNELSFLKSLRQRRALDINGPRGCTISGSTLFVTGYFSDSAESIDLVTGEKKTVSLGSQAPMTTVREGEMLFNDASLCYQKWQSCASCHPDGRADGLNWDLLNDGIGNPKSTKSLLYSHETPPAMITGIRDRAETAVRAGILYIQFVSRPESDAQAMDAYLKSLRPVESPYRVNGKLSQSARAGQKIFKQANCARCHSGTYFTNLKSYDIGLGEGWDKNKKFDTPTLAEIWRTGPYLYDGRAETIEEVIKEYNIHDQHGITSTLTPQEIQELTDYVLSQ